MAENENSCETKLVHVEANEEKNTDTHNVDTQNPPGNEANSGLVSDVKKKKKKKKKG